MKFKYKRYSPTVLRPVIPIEIVHRNNSVKYEVLVDSGADLCVFDAQIGEILGIAVETGEKRIVRGITGIPEYYYLHRVEIKVGGLNHSAEVGFFPKMDKNTYGVVGQKGFFDHYSIKFDLNKKEIELKSSINLKLN